VGVSLPPVPYACESCRSRGSPNGVLVFPSDGRWPVPECRYHREPLPMTRSRFFDQDGNRVTTPQEKE